MRPMLPRLLAGLACCALPTIAAADPLTPVSFRQVIEAAKEYAADRTLVFYCLRKQAEMAPFFYYILHSETQDALVQLKGAGGTPDQNAELVRTILANTRFSPPDANDPALEADCKSKDVEKNYYAFTGRISFPLAMREPVKSLGR
jgi:hypothetical protein